MHLEIQSHIFDNVDRPNLVDVAFSEFGPSVSPESRSKPCIILDLSIEVLRKFCLNSNGVYPIVLIRHINHDYSGANTLYIHIDMG